MTSPVKLDPKLLQSDFNPFQRICEDLVDNTITPFEYRSYRDYLTFLKMIGNRLINDYNDYENKNEEYLTESWWQSVYEVELDRESFVIFSKILLNKTGYLMEKLLNTRSKHSWSDSFTNHRKWFIENSDKRPEYSKILQDMHWYDTSLLLMRDKIIEHGVRLTGSARSIPEGIEYTRINETFMLSTKDYQRLQKIIQKYAKIHSELRSINPINAVTLQIFINLITEHNIKLNEEDYTVLGEIVMRTGGNIDVDILSRNLRKFLDNAAALFG